ncbi:hypothetical protein LTR94_032498, partial [Friedmanniomyces endolithicus]
MGNSVKRATLIGWAFGFGWSVAGMHWLSVLMTRFAHLPVLLAVVAIVALTIGSGILIARRLGFSDAFGTLAGGAVAICGASAALALATTLGERRASQAQLTLVLVVISALSALAMVTYPFVAHWLMMSDLKAGFLLGASIHD